MRQTLTFEGVQEARKFTFDCIDERLNNLNFSEGAFNKQFESLYKQVVALQDAIKAIKNTQNEQSREIVSLQKRIWALEPSAENARSAKMTQIAHRTRLKSELKTELLEFINGELAKETDGLKTTLAEYENGLKTSEVAEAKAEVQKADETLDAIIERRRAYSKNYYLKKRDEIIKSAFKLYRQNKKRLMQGGITEHYFAKLVDIRKKLRNLKKRTPMADVEWCLGLVNRFGDEAIKIFKKSLDFHAQTGKQPERTFKISNFEKVGIFAENKGA